MTTSEHPSVAVLLEMISERDTTIAFLATHRNWECYGCDACGTPVAIDVGEMELRTLVHCAEKANDGDFTYLTCAQCEFDWNQTVAIHPPHTFDWNQTVAIHPPHTTIALRRTQRQ